MRINLVALCYRGSYFYKQYGPAIRDLQMTLTLKKIDGVSVTILERPTSIVERLLGKSYSSMLADDYDVEVYDDTSWEIIGPAFRRLWFEKLIPAYLDKVLHSFRRDNSINVFLDFMPVGSPTAESLEGWFYWYDFIDNFTKHNRFNKFEHQAAARKYSFVKQHADLLTFVSEDCRRSIHGTSESCGQSVVLTNKVFENSVVTRDRDTPYDTNQHFDFGFIGFITDKFDVEAIAELSKNYTIAIYGEFLDSYIRQRLSNMVNVSLFGGFHYSDLPQICLTFRVGLLPYLSERSHDGSPLKLYEYLRYRRPVVTSIDYELTHHRFIFNYKKGGMHIDTFDELLELAGNESIDVLLNDDDYFEAPLRRIVDMISAEVLT
jgi:hypothetical protein